MKFKEGDERKSEGRAGGGREEERTRRKGDEETNETRKGSNLPCLEENTFLHDSFDFQLNLASPIVRESLVQCQDKQKIRCTALTASAA